MNIPEHHLTAAGYQRNPAPNYRHHPTWYRVYKRVSRAMMREIWKRKFASFGKDAWVDLPAYIVGHKCIDLADHVRVWRHVRMEARSIRDGAIRISIGQNTGIQPYVHIGAEESVRIGSNCRIAQGVYITDHDHDYSDLDNPDSLGKSMIVSPVTIEDYVWLGERVIVLKGVTIGAKSVVGAGSVVTKSLPSGVIAAGVPARVLRVWDRSTKSWVKPEVDM